MSELTQEYFEQHLKEQLSAQTSELKAYAREQTDELARITSGGFARTEERFDELETRLDVTAQLKAFERKFRKLEEALHITLQKSMPQEAGTPLPAFLVPPSCSGLDGFCRK